MRNAVILLSGGLDSVVSAAIAQATCRLRLAITFDYGQRARVREAEAARRFCNLWDVPHDVVELPWLKRLASSALVNNERPLPQYSQQDLLDAKKQEVSAAQVWVPNRNGVFINVAAAFAEASGCELIVTGFNAEEAATFPDNSGAYVEAVSAALKFSTMNKAKVISFTQEMSKVEIARKGRELGINLDWCWPCYESGDTMCGKCESCARFQRAICTQSI